ncbi:MAG: nucleotide exchange factor GrpE [Candidatus Dasytiphilus stammeri]
MSSKSKDKKSTITNNNNTIKTENEKKNGLCDNDNNEIKNHHLNSQNNSKDNNYEERIATLEMQLLEAQKHERDQFLRAQAEIQNIRKRADLEMEKTSKFALEKFMGELLPVIDSLERALKMADKSHLQLFSMIEGVELTFKCLLNTIQKYGVKVIKETQVPFNPDIHQAMSIKEIEECKDIKTNTVLEIIQPGYILNGRLLRPAMVIVSKYKMNSS